MTFILRERHYLRSKFDYGEGTNTDGHGQARTGEGVREILDFGFWMKKSGDRNNLGFGVDEGLVLFCGHKCINISVAPLGLGEEEGK